MSDNNEELEGETTEDPELTSFFNELATSGVLSTEALSEINSHYKNLAGRASAGRLQVEQTAQNAETQSEQDLRAKIQDMSVAEKIKLALLGDATCRGLLVTDTNRLVQQSVLANPRLQIGEVELFAKNTNVAEFILRTIGSNRTWVKNYPVKLNLVSNPKTPNDLALRWLRHLNKNDLRRLAKSKNIPQLVAITARKLLAQMTKT